MPSKVPPSPLPPIKPTGAGTKPAAVVSDVKPGSANGKPLPGKPAAQTGKVSKPKPVRPGWYWWLALGSLVVLELVGIGATITMITKKAKAVQSLRSTQVSVAISDQDAKLLTKALAESEADRKRLAAAFPIEGNLLEFIKHVDQIRNSPVTVVRFTVDSDTPTKIGRSPSFLPMSLMLKGKESEVYAALESLAQSPYFIKPITVIVDVDPAHKEVLVQTQFHLFVADTFVQVNP